MARLMRAGCTTAFTIDGAEGPPSWQDGRGIAGESLAIQSCRLVWCSRATGKLPVGLVPGSKPFTRACVYVARQFMFPAHADENML